jgi:hypothetical protein
MRNFDSQEMGIKKLIKNIYDQRGIYGFYAGFRINLLRILPNTAIMFMCYEYLTRFLSSKVNNIGS